MANRKKRFLMADLKRVYVASTEETALAELDKFPSDGGIINHRYRRYLQFYKNR